MSAVNEHLRAELAVFLKTKRKQLRPIDYGYRITSARRTSGLRREEVAELAQVGPTWYTWLEQGRNIRASERVLHSIAKVLRLNVAETRHLLALAGYSRPAHSSAQDKAFDPSLQDVVDAFTCPAFIRNARYDVLTWNPAFASVFDFRADDPVIERNFLWRLFTQRWRHVELPNWRELAKHSIADLRMMYAHHGDSPAFRSLISDLCVSSPTFSQWWAEYPIEEPTDVPQRVVHQTAGELHLRICHFDVPGYAGLKLVLAAPERATPTEAKLQALSKTCAASEQASAPTTGSAS